MRRLIGGTPLKTERNAPAPLEKENSKRRSLAFLSFSPDRRTTSASMRRTREQHKQIAKAVDSDSVDKDHSQLLPMMKNSKQTLTETSDSFSQASSGVGSAFGVLEAPSEPLHRRSPLEKFVERQKGSSQSGSAVSESSEGLNRVLASKSINSMPTLPSNSTMNARNLSNSSTASTSTSLSAGAAARRRARRQQEPVGSYHELGAVDQLGAQPSSPYPMNRMLSNTSASSRGSGGRSQHINRLTNYVQTSKGTIDYPSPGASIDSHASSETDLFKTTFDHQGFTFDAFGLDEQQVDQEVSLAIQELQSTSLFYQEEFPIQSFDTPPGSVADGSQSPTPIDEDGFEDGFRVTVPSMANASPGSSDRSSLTESTDKKDGSGRSNIFKEQAGWSLRSAKRIPPADANWTDFGKYRTSPPSMPDIQRAASETGNKSDIGNRSDYGAPSSAGVPSDVAIQSDFGVNSDVILNIGGDELEIPVVVKGRKDKKNLDVFDEMKDQITISHGAKPVASLRGKWESRQMRKQDGTNTENARSSPESPQPKNNQSANTVTLRRVQIEPETDQQKRVTECAQQRTSLSSHRERLRPSHLRLDVSSSKSDVGSSRPHSVSNSVMSRVRGYGQQESSQRDTHSDSGKPIFPLVKLRATGGVSKFENPSKHFDDDPWRDDDGGQLDDNEYDQEYPHEHNERPLSYKERREMQSRQQHNETFDNKIGNQSPRHQPRKLTYREVRDKELLEQQEIERLKKNEKVMTPKSLDVAALIRKRIAANKQKASMILDNDTNGGRNEEEHKPLRGLRKVSMESKITQFRAPVERVTEELSPQRKQEEPDAMQYLSPHEHQKSLTETLEPTHSYPIHRPQQISPPHEGHRPLNQSIKEDLVLRGLPKATMAPVDVLARISASSSSAVSVKLPKAESIVEQRQESISASSADTKKQLNAFLANRLAGGPSLDRTNPSIVDEAMNFTSNKQMALNQTIPSGPSYSTVAPPVVLTFQSDNISPEAPSSASDSRPALKNDPKYDRYFRMLKVGMPLEVVKHAMTRDGVDPSVMDGDHNKPAGFGSGPSLKDDPKYEKYFKMLKMGLPMGAVQNAMERDGVDPSVMERDHSLPANVHAGGESLSAMENLPKDTHRRTRLHWDTLRKVRSNSLWAKINQDEELDCIDIDEEEFAQLFQAELAPTQAHKAKSGVSSKRGAAVRVIDSKRANNGGIILARLKMTHDEMADAVDRIDDNALTSEQMQNIVEYLPTLEERKALESYMLSGGTDAAEKFDGLCECEKFMVAMMTVKYAKRKVRALLFKLQYGSCLQSLVKDASIVETACDELSNSVRLRKLLGIVLNVGNRLNTAGVSTKQRAGAFKLESLLKLSHAKAFDKTTTFLHYIILVVQRNNELLLRFKDDLPTVLKADKVYWDQCVTDLEEVENHLENVRRIALHQARLALSYRVKRKSTSTEEDGESLSDCSMSLEEEVELLRATPIGIFTLAAIKKVSTLRDKVESTKVKFAKLLEYFGEEERQDMQPHELFNIMVNFCKDFEKAKEQVYDSTKKKMREDRKIQASSKVVPPSPKPPQIQSSVSSRKALPRVSSLQPNMSSLMNTTAKYSGRTSDFICEEPPAQNGQHSRQQTPPVTYSPSPRADAQADWSKTVSTSPGDKFNIGDTPRRSPTNSCPTHDPNSSMRQKARERRHRISGRSSVSSSTSVTSSTTGTSYGSIVRQTADQMKSQPLSPRSSIRQRRRVEQRQTRGAGTEWPDTADQNMQRLRLDVNY